LDRITLDRRLFLGGLSLTGLAALDHPLRRAVLGDGPGGMASAMSTASERTDAVLDDLTGQLRSIAAAYGTVPPAQTAVAAWSLERQVGVMSRWRVPRPRRTAWHALHARVLVLEGNALVDVGDIDCGARAIESAELLATRIGDWPTVAHTFAVRAMVARGNGDLPTALSLARQGSRYAGRAPVAVMLAVAEASATARMGDVAGTRDVLDRGRRVMERLPASAHGEPGYSLDSYHPAQFALMAASALVLAKDVTSAEPYLRTARAAILPAWARTEPGAGLSPAASASSALPRPPIPAQLPARPASPSRSRGSFSSGLSPLLRVVAADAALSAQRPDLDVARTELTEAVADGRDRPSAWLADEVRSLARVAASRGADFSALVNEVTSWKPGRSPATGSGSPAT